MLRTTYELEEGPSHVPLDAYVERSRQQYIDVISRNPAEREVQSFLEKHPMFVPGHSTPGAFSGHYPLHCALITQPMLPGLRRYRPDFMWIATHSGGWFPTLIEIEKPGKKLFNVKGNPRSNFTEARSQLARWRTWFSRPGNVQQFKDYYGVPDFMQERTMQLHMILIYGRRAEFEGNPELTGEIASLLPGPGEELMSFDRLTPDNSMQHAITVKMTGPKRYRSVWVPEVFETGPILAERFNRVDGLAESIDKNDCISKERAQFLKERIRYWASWAAAGQSGLIKGSPWE